MNTTTLRLRPIALAAIFAASVVSSGTSFGQTTATTDPVGYYTMSIVGGADNVMSLPMVRDAVFAGTVATGPGNITANSLKALAGAVSPAWTTSPKQFVYASGSQPLTYYVEFTSGALRGLYYKIADNTADTLTLDTEGDSLLSHDLPGAPGATLAAGDSFKIRPYWRVADVFEANGQPILKPKADEFDNTNDDILFPIYADAGVAGSVNINKPAGLIVHYITGTGWRAAGFPSQSFADQIIRPNEALVVRRRGATTISLTNLGSVLMNRSIYFFSGGSAQKGNDSYFSISRPSNVSLDNSGIRTATQSSSPLVDTPSEFDAGAYDVLLSFDPPALNAGYNLPSSHIYYYLAGSGWREIGNLSTTVGQDVKLEPGRAYILRKRVGTTGRDWVNEPNY